MKILIRILILTLLLFSCQTDKVLQGTWIGVYSYSDKNPNLLPIRNLITFDKSKFNSQGFWVDGYKEINGEYNSISKELKTNEVREELFIYVDKIEKITHDSLIIKTISENGDEFGRRKVYKKINDSLKSKSNINLIGKKFIIKSEKNKDTIFFKNDSLLLNMASKSKVQYERLNYNGFDILFMSDDAPYVIYKQKDNKIYALVFSLKVIELELIEYE